MHVLIAVCAEIDNDLPVNFGEWQHLRPEAAAREVRRRAEANLPAGLRSAAIAALLDEATLTAGFAAAPLGGPLRGVPYLLKDMFDVAGLPTFAGSSFLPEVRPNSGRESGIVRDLASTGGVMAGQDPTL